MVNLVLVGNFCGKKVMVLVRVLFGSDESDWLLRVIWLLLGDCWFDSKLIKVDLLELLWLSIIVSLWVGMVKWLIVKMVCLLWIIWILVNWNIDFFNNWYLIKIINFVRSGSCFVVNYLRIWIIGDFKW